MATPREEITDIRTKYGVLNVFYDDTFGEYMAVLQNHESGRFLTSRISHATYKELAKIMGKK